MWAEPECSVIFPLTETESEVKPNQLTDTETGTAQNGQNLNQNRNEVVQNSIGIGTEIRSWN